jgi:hypothetical protein
MNVFEKLLESVSPKPEGYYMLLESKSVRKCETWREVEDSKANDLNNRMAYSQVTTAQAYYEISTVFTVIDMNPRNKLEKPHVFESKVFGLGPHANISNTYSDWDAAMAGHFEGVRHLLECEGYPSLWRKIRGWLMWTLKGTPSYAKIAKRTSAKWNKEKGLLAGGSRPDSRSKCRH